METRFTKEELFEIEKLFDYQASNSMEQFTRWVMYMEKYNKEQAQKFADSHISFWNMFRSISAKAALLRTEKEELGL